MIKKILLLSVCCSAAFAMSQDITGKWLTVDDKTKQPKSIVQISNHGGVYSGRIISLEKGVSANCEDCKGSFKGKPLVGATILTGLKLVGANQYEGGRITNPKDSNSYKANAQLSANGNTLHVRGYKGVSAIGRTQIWQRVP